MPKPPYFEHLPSSEKPPSMEHALEMARPKRGEIEFPELTKEEKAYLLSLLEEAKKAEEAIKGEPNEEKRRALYEKAIELYTKVKEEFLAIKERKEKEKRRPETIITAKTPEGKEIVFEMEKIREHWFNFYKEHNLEEMAKALPETISLTQEQIERIQKLAETEGFNYFILLPANPDQYLEKIKEETSNKPLKSLPDNQQYTETYLSDDVKPAFPDQIKTLNRKKDKAYLVFIKDSQEVDPATPDKTAEELRREFQEKDLQGLTLTEYFLFQRDFTERHKDQDKPHPDTTYSTWLLDSEIDSEMFSSLVLDAYWNPYLRHVRVDSFISDYHDDPLGCRSSAVLEI